jgi:hypothetical protein
VEWDFKKLSIAVLCGAVCLLGNPSIEEQFEHMIDLIEALVVLSNPNFSEVDWKGPRVSAVPMQLPMWHAVHLRM